MEETKIENLEQKVETNENPLGTEKISKLIKRFAIPCIISLVVSSLYNIVDQIFIGQGVGYLGNAATNIVFPFTVITLAFSLMIGDGASSYLSLSLGKNDKESATKGIGNAIAISVILGILFLIIGFVFQDGLLKLFGVTESSYEYAKQYMTYIVIGMPFFIVTNALNSIIRADGSPQYAMATMLVGAILNIILDPILIFGVFGIPGMGVTGAAVATVIGQIVAGILGIYLNQKKNREVRIQMKGFRPAKDIIIQIYGIGIPSIIMQAIGSVMNYGMNRILISFTSTATAVFGAYFKLQSFIFMPVFGLNNGVIPILAYNYGASNRERVIKTIKHSIIYAISIMVVGLFVFQVFPEPLLRMFKASETMLAIGVPALRRISVSFLLAGFCIACSSVFQSLGKAVYSMVISVARQLVVLLPVAYGLAQIGNVDLVWWAFPIAEMMSLGMTIFFMMLYAIRFGRLHGWHQDIT